MIDSERVCDAIGALRSPSEIAQWAERFAVLGEKHRLTLLICVAEGGPISVTDLAVATGMEGARVSQLLRLLRSAGLVSAQRDGRIVRYTLADQDILAVLPLRASSAAHRTA
jgi:ArsR family transcriptional regulator, lead/cadmium/zinc/bismuth-responsive transcriptional repressor